MLTFDCLLLVGDFDTRGFCEAGPLAKGFPSLIDSFKLAQSVKCSSLEKGQLLDLVLSHGLSRSKMEICDTHLSDNFPVLFTTVVLSMWRNTGSSVLHSYIHE